MLVYPTERISWQAGLPKNTHLTIVGCILKKLWDKKYPSLSYSNVIQLFLSSILIEVIRPISSFYFFYEDILHTKKQKTNEHDPLRYFYALKKHKKQNKHLLLRYFYVSKKHKKQTSNFLLIKCIKCKQATFCSEICIC